MESREPTAEYATRTPAPPDLLARARKYVEEFPGCFWFWHPEATVETREDVRNIIRNLREYGDKQAWLAASELSKCL